MNPYFFDIVNNSIVPVVVAIGLLVALYQFPRDKSKAIWGIVGVIFLVIAQAMVSAYQGSATAAAGGVISMTQFPVVGDNISGVSFWSSWEMMTINGLIAWGVFILSTVLAWLTNLYVIATAFTVLGLYAYWRIVVHGDAKGALRFFLTLFAVALLCLAPIVSVGKTPSPNSLDAATQEAISEAMIGDADAPLSKKQAIAQARTIPLLPAFVLWSSDALVESLLGAMGNQPLADRGGQYQAIRQSVGVAKMEDGIRSQISALRGHCGGARVFTSDLLSQGMKPESEKAFENFGDAGKMRRRMESLIALWNSVPPVNSGNARGVVLGPLWDLGNLNVPMEAFYDNDAVEGRRPRGTNASSSETSGGGRFSYVIQSPWGLTAYNQRYRKGGLDDPRFGTAGFQETVPYCATSIKVGDTVKDGNVAAVRVRSATPEDVQDPVTYAMAKLIPLSTPTGTSPTAQGSRGNGYINTVDQGDILRYKIWESAVQGCSEVRSSSDKRFWGCLVFRGWNTSVSGISDPGELAIVKKLQASFDDTTKTFYYDATSGRSTALSIARFNLLTEASMFKTTVDELYSHGGGSFGKRWGYDTSVTAVASMDAVGPVFKEDAVPVSTLLRDRLGSRAAVEKVMSSLKVVDSQHASDPTLAMSRYTRPKTAIQQGDALAGDRALARTLVWIYLSAPGHRADASGTADAVPNGGMTTDSDWFSLSGWLKALVVGGAALMSLALPLLAGLASLMATIIQMCMPYVIGLCVSLLLILYPAFVVYSIVNPRSWWVPLADWARAGIWFYSWMIFIVIGRGMLDGAAMADLTQNGASFDNGADIGWSVRQFIGVGLITMAPMLASAILAPSFQALASGIQGVNGQVSRVGGALVTLAVAAVTAGAGAVAGAGAAKAGAKAAASTTGSDEAKAAAYDRAERRSMQSSQGVLGSIRGAGDLGGAFGSEQGSMGQGSAAAGNLSRGMEQVGTTTGGRVGEARQAASARSAIDRFNADPNPSADTQEAARQGANILAGNPMAGLDSGGGSMTANQASRGSFHQRAGQRNSMSATQMDSKAADLEVAAESAPPADAAAMRAQAQSLRSGAAEQWSAASKNYESAGGALMKAGNARDAASSYTHAAESAAHANQPERAREMLAHAGGARSLADSMAPRPDEDGGKAAALSQQQAIGGQMAAVEAGGRGMRLAGLTPTDSKAALGAYLTRGESAVMGMPPAQAEAVRQMGASVTKAQSMLNQEAGAASVALDQAQSEFKANPSAATAQRVAAASHRLASASSESQYLSDRYGAPGAVGNPSSRLDAAAQDVEGSGVAGSGFYGNSIKAASQVLQGDRSGAADSLRLAAGDTSMSPQMQTNARHAAEMIGTTGASGMPPAHAMEILTNGVGGNSHGGVVGQGMQVFAGLHRENPVMERQPAPTSGVDLPSIAWSASTGALGGEGVPATGGAVNGDVGRMVEIVGGAGAPANQPVPMPGDPGTAPAPSVVPVVGGAPITGAPVAGPSVPVAGGATGSPTPDVSAISGGGPTTSMTGGIPGSPHGTSEAANATGGRPRNEQTGG